MLYLLIYRDLPGNLKKGLIRAPSLHQLEIKWFRTPLLPSNWLELFVGIWEAGSFTAVVWPKVDGVYQRTPHDTRTLSVLSKIVFPVTQPDPRGSNSGKEKEETWDTGVVGEQKEEE